MCSVKNHSNLQQIEDPPWPSGYDAWLSSVRSQVRASAESSKCAVLWRTVYDPSATERPLETIHEEKGISSQFWVSIVSRYDLSC